ncbi:hypothetical protein TRVL_05599 [Trypanosoma vivax]|nr:hypothetical protein TRVL_05599 [Trypanosoma vivax]
MRLRLSAFRCGCAECPMHFRTKRGRVSLIRFPMRTMRQLPMLLAAILRWRPEGLKCSACAVVVRICVARRTAARPCANAYAEHSAACASSESAWCRSAEVNSTSICFASRTRAASPQRPIHAIRGAAAKVPSPPVSAACSKCTWNGKRPVHKVETSRNTSSPTICSWQSQTHAGANGTSDATQHARAQALHFFATRHGGTHQATCRAQQYSAHTPLRGKALISRLMLLAARPKQRREKAVQTEQCKVKGTPRATRCTLSQAFTLCQSEAA